MRKVLLLGKPNTGKTLLFNKLTGLNQKVANFAGATVEIKSGKLENTIIVDFPGSYSLDPLSLDEEVAINHYYSELNNEDVNLVAIVLDSTRLERSLVFALQAAQKAFLSNKKVLFVFNMIDEINKLNLTIDTNSIQNHLGIPILKVSAKKEIGIEELKQKLLQSDIDLPNEIISSINPIRKAKELTQRFGPNVESLLKKQNKLDDIFLSSSLGGLIFFFIMLILFQSIFSWASPLMDLTEMLIGLSSDFVTSFISNQVIKDFVTDAIFGGLGSFLVFVPQIAILTFIIGFLEDSGYLARAALICHRPLSFFGLDGKSFIPYLSGHACAIPAIMAARTIESPRKRLLTILTIPFTVCSARLPVYALLVMILIPEKKLLGGLINYQGIAFFGLYLFGILCALISSGLINRFTNNKGKENEAPFIMELPPYRIPALKNLIYKSLNSAKEFLVNAGPLIFSITVIIWILGYFPMSEAGLSGSLLAQLGKLFEPVFSPIGLDWKYGVAILTSFAAREVFVGTLGTLFNMESAEEQLSTLSEKMVGSGLSTASGFSILVFYAIALQCVATVAIIQKEIGSKKKAWLLFFGYLLLAYIAAFLTYSLLS